jgi:DNA-binding CsgD family transcriptional regulator
MLMDPKCPTPATVDDGPTEALASLEAAMTAKIDPIRVIETGYDFDGSATDWLTRIAHEMRPLMDDGHGIYAYEFDVEKPARTWFEKLVMVDVDPARLRAANELVVRTQGVQNPIHAYTEPMASISEILSAFQRDGVLASTPPQWAEYCRILGIRDNLGFRTVEPGGRGITITAGQNRERTVDRRTKRLWARVASHLAAARRLRETLTADHTSTSGVDAVLTPSGRVAHAEGPAEGIGARAALRRAVLAQDQARSRACRSDPHAAVETWRALVAGRWSLVEQFESDGRRYLVARRNEVLVPDPRALTPRERAVAHAAALGKSNKLIAYELGLCPSTVATHISTAARKLGVASRSALVARVAAIMRGMPDPQPATAS